MEFSTTKQILCSWCRCVTNNEFGSFCKTFNTDFPFTELHCGSSRLYYANSVQVLPVLNSIK